MAKMPQFSPSTLYRSVSQEAPCVAVGLKLEMLMDAMVTRTFRTRPLLPCALISYPQPEIRDRGLDVSAHSMEDLDDVLPSDVSGAGLTHWGGSVTRSYGWLSLGSGSCNG